jgi:glucose/mannose-6-phosphate isomerase
MFGALAGILGSAGILTLKTSDFKRTSAALQRMVKEVDIDVPLDSNHAKHLAADLYGKIPSMYGSGALVGVARRWKTQFNENSKNLAFFEAFPELVHNSIAGYSLPSWSKRRASVILLRAPFLNPRVMIQYDAVIDLLSKGKIPHRVIDAKGEDALTQLLGTVLLGDFTSYYLAVLNEVDPTPLPAVDFVKSRMADSKNRRD